VFSQDLTEETGSYQPENQQKLFRFVAADNRGEKIKNLEKLYTLLLAHHSLL
jgi:hypothetical protein